MIVIIKCSSRRRRCFAGFSSESFDKGFSCVCSNKTINAKFEARIISVIEVRSSCVIKLSSNRYNNCQY